MEDKTITQGESHHQLLLLLLLIGKELFAVSYYYLFPSLSPANRGKNHQGEFLPCAAAIVFAIVFAIIIFASFYPCHPILMFFVLIIYSIRQNAR